MFLTRFENLLHHPKGAARQLSSVDRDPGRGGTWFGLRPAPARRKRILLEPGETHTMGTMSGAGLITRIWLTTLLPINSAALRDLVLRFYWDEEENPSVECPLGDFFGAPFGHYVQYTAESVSITSGGFTCHWPMPFNNGARLEIQNEGSKVVDPIFFQITYYEYKKPLDTKLRYHARWHRENPTKKYAPYTILEAEGAGHYVGCHLFMQNRQWWLRPPLKTIIFPYGFGMGMLEGWERIWVDGEEKPSIHGTGSEDYFNAGWYFKWGAFSASDYGCTVRSYLKGRAAAYRFDVHAPVPFSRSARVTMDHGFENSVECDYTSVAYWYQIEPHRPFLPLPTATERRPTSPIANIAQSVLSLGAPLLAEFLLGQKIWK